MKIDWDKNKLVPVIAQDFKSGEVLMLAYMNEEAFNLSQSTLFAHYFSRSKGRIWKKGESSGHTQVIKEFYLDCDKDTILLKVEQKGVTCHTGRPNCFFNDVLNNKTINDENILHNGISNYDIFDRLYHIVQERKGTDEKSSYVANLLKKGENSYLKKVVEEAAEFTFALKDNNHEEIVYECADLLFHILVALGDKSIHPEKITRELSKRFGLSGIEEKNSRKN